MNLNRNRAGNTRFKRIENVDESSESESEDEDSSKVIHQQQQQQKSNSNNSNIQNGNRNGDDGLLSLNPDEYDSEEEREYLINEKLNYENKLRLKKNKGEGEDEDDEDDEEKGEEEEGGGREKVVESTALNKRKESPFVQKYKIYKLNNSNINNSNSISTSSTTSTTNSRLEHILDINGLSNSNNESNQDVENDDGHNGDSHNVESFTNEIGSEAQNILFIQNELTRSMSFHGFVKQVRFATILYLMPVSIVLLISLMTDWNQKCDFPLKQWAIIQIIIQSLLITNLFFLFIDAPETEPSSPGSSPNTNPTFSRFTFILQIIYRILSSSYLIWFIVGIILTFKAKSNDQCPSSSPYLFWVTYSVVIIQMIMGLLGFMLCCCSCMFSLMRLGLSFEGPERQETASRGATDSMIRKLSIKKYRNGLLPKEDSSCAICLSEYNDDDKIRFLPCKHHYHLDCIDRWLIIDKSCPFCKRDIDKDPSEQSATKGDSESVNTTTTTTTTATTTSSTNNGNDTTIDMSI